MILLPPGTREPRRPSNWWPPENAGWIEYRVTLDGDFPRRLLAEGLIPAQPVVRPNVSGAGVGGVRIDGVRIEGVALGGGDIGSGTIGTDPVKSTFQQVVHRFGRNPDGPPELLVPDAMRLLAVCLEIANPARKPNPAGSHESPGSHESNDESNDETGAETATGRDFDGDNAGGDGGGDAVNGFVAEALAVIRSPGREAISVKELVDEVLVARRTLERAFRRHFGRGVHEEIIRHRLERTKRLLADRSLDLEQVATRSGFGNVRTLRRVFTAAVGVSPRAYRNAAPHHAPHSMPLDAHRDTSVAQA